MWSSWNWSRHIKLENFEFFCRNFISWTLFIKSASNDKTFFWHWKLITCFICRCLLFNCKFRVCLRVDVFKLVFFRHVSKYEWYLDISWKMYPFWTSEKRFWITINTKLPHFNLNTHKFGYVSLQIFRPIFYVLLHYHTKIASTLFLKTLQTHREKTTAKVKCIYIINSIIFSLFLFLFCNWIPFSSIRLNFLHRNHF